MLRHYKRQTKYPPPPPPDEVAYQLLWSMLDEKQRRFLKEKEYFQVGRMFRVFLHPWDCTLYRRWWGTWVPADINVESWYCLPPADQALNLLLHLKAHPDRVRTLKCGDYLASPTV